MKKIHHLTTTTALFGILGALTTASSHAAFVLLDNMEGGNNWSAFDGTPGTIVTDPANSGNNVFSIGYGTNVNNSDSYLSLGSGIAHNTTGTLFLRVRTTANEGAFDWVFGTTHVANPGASGTTGAWNSYVGYGVMNSSGGTDTEMAVRDGTGFDFFGPASPDTWYNVWFVLDNENKETTMYYNTGFGTPATDASTLSATGGFRNVNTDDLINLWVRNNSASTTGYIDDVYLDTTGINLTNPIPEPSTAMIGGLGLLALLRRRR